MLFLIIAILYGLIAIGVTIGITQKSYDTNIFNDVSPIKSVAVSIPAGIIAGIFWPSLFAIIFILKSF